MKISVVIPVYNTEKYLRKCINSVLKQTLDEVEIVAVDDGSTDDSGKILDLFQAENPDRLKVIHKENEGQAVARNLAFQYCTGEYIGFVDSDDYVEPDKFRLMYEKAKELNADYVACGYRDIVYEDGKERTLKAYVAAPLCANQTDMYLNGALVSPWLHMYKRDLIIENHITFPEHLIYEDTAFYINAIPFIHGIAEVEEPLSVRTRHANSTMTITKKEKVAQIFPVLQSSIEFYKNHGFYEQYKDELEYFCTRILLCSSMERISRVACRRDRHELVSRTLDFVSEQFPDYRKNPYLKTGLIHWYMKRFNKFTARLYLSVFRIKSLTGRRYE